MNTISPTSRFLPSAEELRNLRSNWVWFFILGIAMVVLGSIAISWACLATITVTATWLFGFLLLGS
jgi:uncharacterized membrane protein HdeD (DUF308 family)